METGNKGRLQHLDLSVNHRIAIFYGTDFLYISLLNEHRERLVTEYYSFNKIAGDYLLEKIFSDRFAQSAILDAVGVAQVDIYPSHAPYSFVPAPFYKESEARALLSLECELGVSTDVVALELKELDGYLLTAVPQQLNRFFQSYFSQFSWHHPVARRLTKMAQTEKSSAAHVYGMNDRFDLLLFGDDGKLLLTNSYPYQTPEDFVYYLLFVLEQTGLNRLEVPVLLDGFIRSDSPLFNLAYKYIRHVRVARPASDGDPLMWLGPSKEAQPIKNQ